MIVTRKQEAFIDWYVKLRNATEAARRAGYTAKNTNRVASRLLSNVGLKTEIDRRFKVIQEEMSLTEDNIISSLWKEARNASKTSDRINALTQLAKIKGLMKDTATQNVAVFTGLEQQLKNYIQSKQTQPIDSTTPTVIE